MNAVVVRNLKKYFQTPLPVRGSFIQRIQQNFFPHYQAVKAVDGISFQLQPGERVAFIGPNGAGKSTTIKMLTGILHPTEGQIEVLGQNPSIHRQQLSYHIGAVFGQRSQLWYHLPVQETLLLLSAIYEIPQNEYESRLRTLASKFAITDLLKKPVRELSLGERMRCEIVASFIHQPKVLFLDEPTIGLDITAKAIIRTLIREHSEQEGATLLLTSHDTDDIEKVCDRVIVIDRGQILLDDLLTNLKTRYIRKKVITIATEETNPSSSLPHTTILEQSSHHLKLEVDLTVHSMGKVAQFFLDNYTVKDLTIENPPLESIIQMIYNHDHHTT